VIGEAQHAQRAANNRSTVAVAADKRAINEGVER